MGKYKVSEFWVHKGNGTFYSGPEKCCPTCKYCKHHLWLVCKDIKHKLLRVELRKFNKAAIINTTGSLFCQPIEFGLYYKSTFLPVFVVRIDKHGVYNLGFGSKIPCPVMRFGKLTSNLFGLSITNDWLYDKITILIERSKK